MPWVICVIFRLFRSQSGYAVDYYCYISTFPFVSGWGSTVTTFKFFLNICTTSSPGWKCLRSKYHIYVFLNKIFKFLEWFKDIKSDLIKQVVKISIYHSKIYFYLIHFNNELKEEILLSEIYKIKFLSCKGVQSHLVLNFCLCAVR
jgi:hypothetical protein